MSAIYILIGASLSLAAGFLIAFIKNAQAGQFDDDYTPSIRMLMDDEAPQEDTSKQTNTNL
jgi:cbb3-type cytochrome oxidase maturation protein